MGRVGEATPLVSVILVTWNSAPFLPRCLAGFEEQTHEPTELIVVDNASADDSASIVSSRAAHLIRNETNRGFSVAVNQGLRVAKGEFVLLLNPDCFLDPFYLESLLQAFRESGHDFGSATGKLLRGVGSDITPTGVIDSLGIRMTRSGRHLDIAQGTSNMPREHPAIRTFEVFGVSGAAALYRRVFLDDVAIDGEIFDEDFFAYREDADIAWRGRLFGWRAIAVPAAVAYHVRSVTPEARRSLSPEINMHSVKNRFLLRLKNQSSYLALRNSIFEVARDLAVIGAALTIERTSLPAFRWLWSNRQRIMKKRREIQTRRRVSDRDLARWFR